MSDSYSVNTPQPGILSKRVMGVPVVYLAGAIVAILVIIAYLGSKKNTTGATATTATTQAAVDPYTSLASTGTVTTSQPVYFVPANTQNVDTGAALTNVQWQAEAVGYLASTGVSSVDAQTAIQAYANGQDMTYAQKALVDIAIAKFGLPPTPTNVGQTTPSINYADPSIYTTFTRNEKTGVVMGILADGTDHHVTWNEWLAMGQPTSRISVHYPG